MRLAISAWSIVWTDTIFASGKTEFLATQKRNTDRFSWVGVLKEGIYENKTKTTIRKCIFLIFAFVQLNTSQLTQLPLYGGCTVWNTSARLSGRPFFLWTGSHFFGMPFFIEFEREAIFQHFVNIWGSRPFFLFSSLIGENPLNSGCSPATDTAINLAVPHF